MATNDAEQYAAILAGIEEIVPIVTGYSQIEVLYLSRPKAISKQEFNRNLLSSYSASTSPMRLVDTGRQDDVAIVVGLLAFRRIRRGHGSDDSSGLCPIALL
jgi:hypothetical protein